MPRFSIKKIMPTAETVKGSKSLKFLGKFLHDPNLFHLNRRSVAKAFFWGIFIGLMPPIPVQTPAAALAALVSRSNLPLTIAVIWISNPLTIPFIMYAFYHLGRVILQMDAATELEFSWAWLIQEFKIVWKPYLVGCILGATGCAAIGYALSNFIWRRNVKRKWVARKKQRAVRIQ